MRAKTTILGLGMAALLLGACEGGVTMPEGMAAVNVEAEGDGSGSVQNATTSSGGESAGSGEVQGTVEVRARVWARTTAGEWMELTAGSAKRVVVDARRRTGPQAYFGTHVKAESYDRVRVEFEEVKARATGGALISADLVGAEVRVELGQGGRIVVERSVELRAEAGSRSRLVIDLNASEWMSRVNATTRTAARADFESAVRVYAR